MHSFDIYKEIKKENRTHVYFCFQLNEEEKLYYSVYFILHKSHILNFSSCYAEEINGANYRMPEEWKSMIVSRVIKEKNHRLKHLVQPYKIYI